MDILSDMQILAEQCIFKTAYDCSNLIILSNIWVKSVSFININW